MCGLVGMIGKKLEAKHEDMIEDGLMICAPLRGRDSVGVGIVPFEIKYKPFVNKRVGEPPYLVRLPVDGGRAMLGHVRSATIGSKADRELAQPFIFDNIIGCHNGTLRGDWRKVLEDQTNEKFGSDSQAVFYNFAYWGVEETVKSILGAWCFVWWDDDEQTLNMLRNHERPLWLAKGKTGHIYWASEHWMINGMLRAGERDRDTLVRTPTADGKEEFFFHKLPANMWRRYTFDDKGEVIQLDDIPLEGMEPPKIVHTYQASKGYMFSSELDGDDDLNDWGYPMMGFHSSSSETNRDANPSSVPNVVPIKGKSLAVIHGAKEKGQVYARFEDKMWKESPEPCEGSVKISKEYAAGALNSKGELYRVINGVGYVSRPGGEDEIPFRTLVEFKTDGCCTLCADQIKHPIDIGYLPKDYSWMACRDCCDAWLGQPTGAKSWLKLMEEMDTDVAKFGLPEWPDPRPEDVQLAVIFYGGDVVDEDGVVPLTQEQATKEYDEAVQAFEATKKAQKTLKKEPVPLSVNQQSKRGKRRDKGKNLPAIQTGPALSLKDKAAKQDALNFNDADLADIRGDDDPIPVDLADSLPPALVNKLNNRAKLGLTRPNSGKWNWWADGVGSRNKWN